MDAVHAALADYEFSYADQLGRRATHRIRIFTPGTWTTVLITDRSEKHHCPSVTNAIEELIDALLPAHPEISRERLVVIEHYDDRSSWRPVVSGAAPPATRETFDLVSFSYSADKRAFDPNWRRVTKAEAEQDRPWPSPGIPLRPPTDRPYHESQNMLPTQNQLLLPLVEVIATAGGSMRAKDASNAIASRFELSSEQHDQCARTRGGKRFNILERTIRWTHQLGKLRGLTANEGSGLWRLTERVEDKRENIRPAVVVTLFENDSGIVVWATAEELESKLADRI